MSEMDGEIEQQLTEHSGNLRLWLDRAIKNGWNMQALADIYADAYADTINISIKKGNIDIGLMVLNRKDSFYKRK